MEDGVYPIAFNARRQILLLRRRAGVHVADEEPPRRRRRRALLGVVACGSVVVVVLSWLTWLLWPSRSTILPQQPAAPAAPPPRAPPAPPLWPPGAKGDTPSPPPAQPPEQLVRFYEVARAVSGELAEHTRIDLPVHDVMYGVFENTAAGRERNNVHTKALWDIFFMSNLQIVSYMKLNRCYTQPVDLIRSIALFWPVYFSLWDARNVYLELYRSPNCVPPDIAWNSGNVTLEEVWPVYFRTQRSNLGVRISQPTLQFQCRTGLNGCDRSAFGFMQWETVSAVQEAFVGVTTQDYIAHFMAKLVHELEYEANTPVDVDPASVAYSIDAQGRDLVVFRGSQVVFRNFAVQLTLAGSHSEVERGAEDAIAAQLQSYGFEQRLFPLVSLYLMQIQSDWGHMWSGHAGDLPATRFYAVRYTAERFAEHAGFGPMPITFRETVFRRDGRPELGNITVPSVTGNLRLTEGSVQYHVNTVKTGSVAFRLFVNATAGGAVRGVDCAPSYSAQRPFLDIRCRAVVAVLV